MLLLIDKFDLSNHYFRYLLTGQYGVPEGMVFSFPVTIGACGNWRIVEGIEISDENKEKIKAIVKVINSMKKKRDSQR